MKLDLNISFSDPKVIIVNVIIVLFIVLATYDGFKKGFFESFLRFIGFLLASILAFVFKNKLSVVLYTYLPFFKFGGAFKGIYAINILLYELLAYFIIFFVILIVFSLLIKMTHVIEKVIKAIPLIGFLDRLLGAFIGFVQSFIILYLVLFVFKFCSNLFGFNIRESLVDNILEIKVLNDKFGNSLDTFNQITELKNSYDSTQKEEFNNKSIQILLDNKIITQENLDLLIEKGKLTYTEK